VYEWEKRSRIRLCICQPQCGNRGGGVNAPEMGGLSGWTIIEQAQTASSNQSNAPVAKYQSFDYRQARVKCHLKKTEAGAQTITHSSLKGVMSCARARAVNQEITFSVHLVCKRLRRGKL